MTDLLELGSQGLLFSPDLQAWVWGWITEFKAVCCAVTDKTEYGTKFSTLLWKNLCVGCR